MDAINKRLTELTKRIVKKITTQRKEKITRKTVVLKSEVDIAREVSETAKDLGGDNTSRFTFKGYKDENEYLQDIKEQQKEEQKKQQKIKKQKPKNRGISR